MPTGLRQSCNEDVASRLIHIAYPGGVFITFPQRCDSGDLYRLEDAVIEVALYASQRRNQFSISQTEADTPARHVIALRHGIDLDCMIGSTLDFENAGRAVAIEPKLGICKVMNDIRAVLTRQLDDLTHEGQVDADRGRVVRERNENDLGTFSNSAQKVLQAIEKRRGVG